MCLVNSMLRYQGSRIAADMASSPSWVRADHTFLPKLPSVSQQQCSMQLFCLSSLGLGSDRSKFRRVGGHFYGGTSEVPEKASILSILDSPIQSILKHQVFS